MYYIEITEKQKGSRTMKYKKAVVTLMYCDGTCDLYFNKTLDEMTINDEIEMINILTKSNIVPDDYADLIESGTLTIKTIQVEEADFANL